jgi:hypothetical protein
VAEEVSMNKLLLSLVAVAACSGTPQPAPKSAAAPAAQPTAGPAGPAPRSAAAPATGGVQPGVAKANLAAAPAPAAASPVCGLPLVRGPCKALFWRYGYDAKKGQCVKFAYGGCGGNANSFPSMEACRKACP